MSKEQLNPQKNPFEEIDQKYADLRPKAMEDIKNKIGAELYNSPQIKKILEGCGNSILGDVAEDISAVRDQLNEQIKEIESGKSKDTGALLVDFYKQPTAVLIVVEELKRKGYEKIKNIGFDYDGFHILYTE